MSIFFKTKCYIIVYLLHITLFTCGLSRTSALDAYLNAILQLLDFMDVFFYRVRNPIKLDSVVNPLSVVPTLVSTPG